LRLWSNQTATLTRERMVPSGRPGLFKRGPSLLAVASGKGGVGKTFLSVNVALALRDLGYRCMVMDLDWGLANVDVALGLAPTLHVGHVMSGECSLEEAVIQHQGLAILPNGCGCTDLAHLEVRQRLALLETVMSSQPRYDFVIADTHPGIGALTVDVLRRAAATIIVSTPEPTALTDTYALLKVLSQTEMQGPAGLVINQAGSSSQAFETARHLDSVSRRFLGRGVAYWGEVLQDVAVPRSVRQQRAMMAVSPRCVAARSVRKIATTAATLLDGPVRRQ
jgi:flagellar biosynthesis protein FlhG